MRFFVLAVLFGLCRSSGANWRTDKAGASRCDVLCAEGKIALGTGTNFQTAREKFRNAAMECPGVASVWVGLSVALASDSAGRDMRSIKTAMRLDRQGPETTQLIKQIRSGKLDIMPLDMRANGLEEMDSEMRERHVRYLLNLYSRYFQLEFGVSRLGQAARQSLPNISTLTHLGKAYVDLMRYKEAYTVAQTLTDAFPTATAGPCLQADIVFTGVMWEHWNSTFSRLIPALSDELDAGGESCVDPLRVMLLPDIDPDLQLKILTKTAAKFRVEHRLTQNLKFGGRNNRLRIGYMTSHFTSSSIGREMLYIIAAHAPARTEILCFDLSNKSDRSVLASVWLGAIESVCKKNAGYLDLHSLATVEAAAEINRRHINVLMDLNGWSGGHRADLLALHPAPLQINYKNYVNSPGFSSVDFTVGDFVTSPPEFRRHYLEGLCLVPPSYFVSGHVYQYERPGWAERAERLATRKKNKLLSAAGTGVLFSNFNNLDKLDPATTREWSRIVLAVKDSTVWIQKFPPAKAAEIIRQCGLVGIPLNRMIATPFSSHEEHIAIKSQADLFLDNPTYSAHSSAMDSLYGGLPILSIPREKMSARVSASMLITLNLPELISRNLHDYGDIAIALGNNPQALENVRRKLHAAGTTSPLFNTINGVRNLERALSLMWDVKLASPPGTRFHVVVARQDAPPEPNTEKILKILKVLTAEYEKLVEVK